MHIECLVNDNGTGLVIVPNTSLEEEILKQLFKQPHNHIVEIRGDVAVLNRSIKHGLYIG